ncbi:FecR family protein [Nibrella saemangeumensis]
MKKYETFSVEDFVMDDHFRDWVQGNINNETFWLAFMHQHPEKTDTIRQAERIIRAMNINPTPVSEQEVRAEVNQFMQQLQTLETSQPVRPMRRSWWWAAAAMVIMVGLGAAVFGLMRRPAEIVASKKPQPTKPAATAALAETVNSTSKTLKLVLSDGSTVHLGPSSALRYAPHFGSESRQVYLTGEAIFEVVHTSAPFLVYAGDVVTKVLGTSFVVRAYETDKKVTVQVRTGKVSVYREAESRKAGPRQHSGNSLNGFVLLPNQAAIYDKAIQQFTKTLVAKPVVIRPAEFVYDDTPLAEVLQQLQQAYGIHLQYDADAFTTCRITATFNDESLFEKLDLICKMVGGTYEIVDGQIVLNVRGC